MNFAEFFAVCGIFAIVWWICRTVARALDRYELMKEQRKHNGNRRRDGMDQRRNTERLPVHPRPLR
jgi:hypothetical protein